MFDRERNVTIEKKKKKIEDGENLFLKALANRFWLTSKVAHSSAELLMADLLSNGLHEKIMICYWKSIKCTVC